MNTVRRDCWCGHKQLENFSSDYGVCRKCNTLVSQAGLSDEALQVSKDEEAFYGKEYWLSHQSEDLGFNDIYKRSRADLSERCLHWLRAILKYKLPPANVLELGSAHGGFVATLKWAGYEAQGLELSPWVVDFARKKFDVPMLVGPIEDQKIETNSLDVIALMDVFEHLPNPVETIRHCLTLLKSDGILVIQMPQYQSDKTYEQMLAEESPFLEQLKTDEHLYLFSIEAVREFFGRLGITHIQIEPAIFAQYDMFLVVSREPLVSHSTEIIETKLMDQPSQCLIQALLDLDSRYKKLEKNFLVAGQDRLNHLEQIRILAERVHAAEHVSEERLKQIHTAEHVNEERLEQIHVLTERVHATEHVSEERLEQIHVLTERVHEAEQARSVIEVDSAERLKQIHILTDMLKKRESAL